MVLKQWRRRRWRLREKRDPLATAEEKVWPLTRFRTTRECGRVYGNQSKKINKLIKKKYGSLLSMARKRLTVRAVMTCSRRAINVDKRL